MTTTDNVREEERTVDHPPVEAELDYRGNGIRAMAVIIALVGGILIRDVIAVFTGATAGTGVELEGSPAFFWLIFFSAYCIILEDQSGQIVGKKAVEIEVVTESGPPVAGSKL